MNRRVNDRDKYRHELKYICDNAEMTVIERKLRSIMRSDTHADENGEYVIRSVYFDDYMRSCYNENVEGVDPREKYRIRIYNYSDGRISLEKKRKSHTMTGKDSCEIDRETCERMLRGKPIHDRLGRHWLLDEWIVRNETMRFYPVVLGEYVRKPLIYRLGNVRITFDRNICASPQVTRMFDRDIARVSVLPTGYHILEVKYDNYLPDIIYQLIDNGHLVQTTFSKFFLGCKAIGGNVYGLS